MLILRLKHQYFRVLSYSRPRSPSEKYEKVGKLSKIFGFFLNVFTLNWNRIWLSEDDGF